VYVCHRQEGILWVHLYGKVFQQLAVLVAYTPRKCALLKVYIYIYMYVFVYIYVCIYMLCTYIY